MYSALIEIGAFGWFDLTVTVSFEFLIGVGFEIDAVQVACGPVPVVIVVPAVAALVVAPANVVTAFVDDGDVVGVDDWLSLRRVGAAPATARQPCGQRD